MHVAKTGAGVSRTGAGVSRTVNEGKNTAATCSRWPRHPCPVSGGYGLVGRTVCFTYRFMTMDAYF